MEPKSLDEIYASFVGLDEAMQSEERREMEKELSTLPKDLKETVSLQFDKIDYFCKKLLGT